MAKNNKNQEVFDQHINVNGRARLLSVGKLIPSSWGWVRVTRTRQADGEVWLHIQEIKMVVGQ